MRTYSRQTRRVFVDDNQNDGQEDVRLAKRRRISEDRDREEVLAVYEEHKTRSSSTSTPGCPTRRCDALISSDDKHINAVDTPSPPSSPPPMKAEIASIALPKLTQTQRQRRRLRHAHASSSRLLADITNSALQTEASGTSAPTETKKIVTKPRRLTQMQIDLGGEVQKACKVCGMEYTPSNVEDRALHKKFHQMNVGGVDLGRRLARHLRTQALQDPKGGKREDGHRETEEAFVVAITPKSSLAERYKAKEVLEVVNTELSAVQLDNDELWGASHDERSKENRRPSPLNLAAPVTKQDTRPHRDRFVVFLYVKREKCVGLCLAERITKAHRVVEEVYQLPDHQAIQSIGPAARSSSVSFATDSRPALLGISRIWTSNSHRRRGIASALLEHARHRFVYGMEVPKKMVAFSQPTESGGNLARCWFEDQSEWLVYLEN